MLDDPKRDENLPDLVLSHHGLVASLTLNRPKSRNALSVSMMTQIEAALELVAASPARVLVLEAEGPAFCAGHDLKEMQQAREHGDGGAAFYRELFSQCSRLMMRLTTLPQPVIAKVHGIATAAGCQLVATCDLAIAAQEARFATPGVDIGLFCSTPSVALSRAVAPKHALSMLFTGEPITAQEAARIGLINEMVMAEELDDVTDALAQRIASKSRTTLEIGKRAFYEQRGCPLGEAYDKASAVMAANMLEADAAEGIAAFLEKRAPNWT